MFTGSDEALLAGLEALDERYIRGQEGTIWVQVTAISEAAAHVAGLTEDAQEEGTVPRREGVIESPGTHARRVAYRTTAEPDSLSRARALCLLGRADLARPIIAAVLDDSDAAERREAFHLASTFVITHRAASQHERFVREALEEFPDDPYLRCQSLRFLDASERAQCITRLRDAFLDPEVGLTTKARIAPYVAGEPGIDVDVGPRDRGPFAWEWARARISQASANGSHRGLRDLTNTLLDCAVVSGARVRRPITRMIRASAFLTLGEHSAVVHELSSEELDIRGQALVGIAHLRMGAFELAERCLTPPAAAEIGGARSGYGPYLFASLLALGVRRVAGTLLVEELADRLDRAPMRDADLRGLIATAAGRIPEDAARLSLLAARLAEFDGEPDAVRRTIAAGLRRIPFGAYDLVERVGAGARGEVWKAEHRASGCVVAVKIVKAGVPHHELVREAQIQAGLHHPAVVSALDAGRVSEETADLADLEPGAPWLVTAFVTGTSLDRAGPPDEPSLRAVLQTTLEALIHCHARGVVHRDLKPSNLMRDEAGRVFVVDFGLAGLGSGRIAGSPAFMPPEQWRGRGIDGRADLYALACTSIALLTGAPPFLGNLAALRAAHNTAEPVIPASATPSFTAWLRRCLEKRADQRFDSAFDALGALPERLLTTPVAVGGIMAPSPTLAPLPETMDAGRQQLGLLEHRQTALLGRGDVQKELWRAVTIATPGTWISLLGDPGTGRTAVMDWLRHSLRERGKGRRLSDRSVVLVDEASPPAQTDAVVVWVAPDEATAKGRIIRLRPLPVDALHDLALSLVDLPPLKALELAQGSAGSPKRLRRLIAEPTAAARRPPTTLAHLLEHGLSDPSADLETIDGAIAASRRLADPRRDARLDTLKTLALLHLCRYREVVAHARQIIDNDDPVYALARCRAHAHVALAFHRLGQSDVGRQHVERGLELLEATEDKRSLAEAWSTAVLLNPTPGRFSAALRAFHDAGEPPDIAHPCLALAEALVVRGDIFAALELTEQWEPLTDARVSLLLLLGRTGEATRAANRAATLLPLTRAWVALASGRTETAIALCMEHGRALEDERLCTLIAAYASDPLRPVEVLVQHVRWKAGSSMDEYVLVLLAQAASAAEEAGLLDRAAQIRSLSERCFAYLDDAVKRKILSLSSADT